MFGMHPFHDYTITRMTRGQRSALLAGVDGDGRLPDATVTARVLNSIPEEWARTDRETGNRFLTPRGRAALLPINRFVCLRRANPETGAVFGLNYRDGQGLHRDGLVIFQNQDGQVAGPTDYWVIKAYPHITERGRKLIGMPLTAPPFASRLPVGSRALWVRQDETPEPVEIKSWPFTDGMVRVRPLIGDGLTYREDEVPAAELSPC
ncbi:hypothetical protein AB0H23_27460 [Streptomyces albogriseolus]|uniref:hypothetical protein n=1 Tax=Streptomyces albogriseolus TaxID=1887 RepID=UPI00345FEB23